MIIRCEGLPLPHTCCHPASPRAQDKATAILSQLDSNTDLEVRKLNISSWIKLFKPSAAVSIEPPNWYDVYNPNIYGSGKTDVNCIAEIVRADMKLRAVLQGE